MGRIMRLKNAHGGCQWLIGGGSQSARSPQGPMGGRQAGVSYGTWRTHGTALAANSRYETTFTRSLANFFFSQSHVSNEGWLRHSRLVEAGSWTRLRRTRGGVSLTGRCPMPSGRADRYIHVSMVPTILSAIRIGALWGRQGEKTRDEKQGQGGAARRSPVWTRLSCRRMRGDFGQRLVGAWRARRGRSGQGCDGLETCDCMLHDEDKSVGMSCDRGRGDGRACPKATRVDENSTTRRKR